MWVVDMNTLEIRTDVQTPSPASASRKRQNSSPSSSIAPPTVKRTRSAPVNGTCAPEQLLCRYANKKCYNPRAVKRGGGLHTFCAMHRANANRNQRRLDMRKRMQRQAQQAQQQELELLGHHSGSSSSDDSSSFNLSIQIPSGDERFEPLAAPTPLEDEDVTTLVSLFLSDSISVSTANSPLAIDESFGSLLDAALSM